MFKSLKEKLKKWVNKVENSTEDTLEITEKKEVKKKKKTTKEEKETKTKKVNEKQKNKKIDKSEKKELKILKTEKKTKKFSFKRKISEEKLESLLEELNLTLLQNNVAYSVVEEIEETLKEKLIGENLSDLNLNEELTKAIEKVLINPPNIIKKIKDSLTKNSPYIIIFVGINGSGKTTTLAKFANLLKKEKISTCLVAADTFRAAAVEQLETHAKNLKLEIIKKEYNSDPASVAFEGISYAKKNKIDVVLIDTAGRLNSKETLMQELKKIVKVAKPNLKIFVGESITGNDAIEQAKSFNELIDIDGIILSKADIDEKGGTAISVSKITKKPILFIGTGQEYSDLEKFDKTKILDSLNLN